MTERYKVGRPVFNKSDVSYPIIDTEIGKVVRQDATTIKEAKRQAYHYNCVEVWND